MRRTPFLVLLLLFPGIVWCQVPWDLARCVAVARERSPYLQIAQNMRGLTALSERENSAGGLPQMKGVASTVLAPWSAKAGYDPAITDGGQLMAQVSIQQSLFDGGIRSLRADQLKLESHERDEEFRRAERDLLFTVRQAYIDALRAQEAVDLERSNVRDLTDYRDLVQRLVTAGSASSTDLLKTDLDLASARIALRTADDAATAAGVTLGEIIGLGPDSTVQAVGTLDSLLLPAAGESSTDPAFHSNLDLTLANLEYQKSLFDVFMARRERYPSISLFGDAGLLTSGDNIRLPVPERSPIVGFSLGLSFEIPLVTWGGAGAREEEKAVASENLRLEREGLRRSIAAEIRRVRLQLRSAIARRDASEEMLRTASENLLLTRSRYAAAGVLALEVLSAQQQLREVRRAALQARADIQSLRARIDQLETE